MQSNLWPYLAGIVDGEGTICANKRAQGDFQLQVAIYNTSLYLMKWLVKNVGGKYYIRSLIGYGGKPGRTQYMWFPSGKKNREKFLLGILPYILLKRDQAILALEFLGLPYGSPKQRQEIADKIRALNRRDVSVETNTLDASPEAKIESELTGDRESAPDVNRGPISTPLTVRTFAEQAAHFQSVTVPANFDFVAEPDID